MVMNERLRRSSWIIVLVAAVALSAPGPTAQGRAPIGTNLSRIDDWSPEYAFVDAFKESRPWISGTLATFEDGRSIDVDPNGWLRSLQPGQVARTLMMNAVPS